MLHSRISTSGAPPRTRTRTAVVIKLRVVPPLFVLPAVPWWHKQAEYVGRLHVLCHQGGGTVPPPRSPPHCRTERTGAPPPPHAPVLHVLPRQLPVGQCAHTQWLHFRVKPAVDQPHQFLGRGRGEREGRHRVRRWCAGGEEERRQPPAPRLLWLKLPLRASQSRRIPPDPRPPPACLHPGALPAPESPPRAAPPDQTGTSSGAPCAPAASQSGACSSCGCARAGGRAGCEQGSQGRASFHGTGAPHAQALGSTQQAPLTCPGTWLHSGWAARTTFQKSPVDQIQGATEAAWAAGQAQQAHSRCPQRRAGCSCTSRAPGLPPHARLQVVGVARGASVAGVQSLRAGSPSYWPLLPSTQAPAHLALGVDAQLVHVVPAGQRARPGVAHKRKDCGSGGGGGSVGRRARGSSHRHRDGCAATCAWQHQPAHARHGTAPGPRLALPRRTAPHPPVYCWNSCLSRSGSTMFSRHTCLPVHFLAHVSGQMLRPGSGRRGGRGSGGGWSRAGRRTAGSACSAAAAAASSVQAPGSACSPAAASGPHVQYMGSSFWPSVMEMLVPAVLKLRTWRQGWRVERRHGRVRRVGGRRLHPTTHPPTAACAQQHQ